MKQPFNNRSISILAMLLFLAFNALNASAVSRFTPQDYDFEVDGIYYNVTSETDKEVGVTYGKITENAGKYYGYDCYYYTNSSYSGEVVIPQTVEYEGNTYTVTSIEHYAFGAPNSTSNWSSFYGIDSSGCTITSIELPNTIKKINSSAFYYCTDFSEVHIQDLSAYCKIPFEYSSANPLSYAHHLFINNEEITNLVIPDDITEIGKFGSIHFFGAFRVY